MYTGIIHYQAKVSGIKKQRSGNRVLQCIVPAQARKRLHIDDSVSVNGACLTVTQLHKGGFSSDVMPETLRLSTLGDLKAGDLANLELSLRASDTLGGHFIMGHVDALGVVEKLEQEGDSVRMRIQTAKALMPYIAKKGSIAVNGVSLTVTEVFQNMFGVALIPHTLAKTNLGILRKGAKVNIEIDAFARIIGRFLEQKYAKNGWIYVR